MSDENKDQSPPTRAELVEMLDEFSGAIKALKEKGGDDLGNLTADEATELREFVDAAKDVKAILDEMPDPAAIKAASDDFSNYLAKPGRRPALGKHTKGTGDESKNEVKAERISPAVSEFEKAVETGPFRNMGHFAHAVKAHGAMVRAGHAHSQVSEWSNICHKSDGAIKALFGEGDVKAVTGLNEFFDSEGGILVPLQFSEGIWKRSMEDDFNLMSAMQVTPVTGQTLTIRAVQDKSRANGSRGGGVLGYWIGEGVQATNTKPTYRTITLKLSKCVVMVPATEELLEDSAAAESQIMTLAADELRFQIGDKLINGSGVGEPQGLLSSPARIDVTTASGANTITAVNLDDMWKRRAKPSGMGYIWLANQEIEGQLANLNYSTTNTGASWAYVPGTAFNGQGLPTLKGKPVYYNEWCAALGTAGDLILVDPTQHAVIVKSTGVRSAVSTHLRFDYDEQVFKFVYRMDARSYWDAPLTRYKGSETLSPVVVLESTRT